ARPFEPAFDRRPIGLLRPALEPFSRLLARIVARQYEGLAQEPIAPHGPALGPALVEFLFPALQRPARRGAQDELLDPDQRRIRDRIRKDESFVRHRIFKRQAAPGKRRPPCNAPRFRQGCRPTSKTRRQRPAPGSRSFATASAPASSSLK